MTLSALYAVYTAIILGAKNYRLKCKTIHKSINRPLNFGLIQNTTECFQAERTLKALEDKNEQERESLNEHHLETARMLQKIIQAFQRKNLSFTA